MCVCVCVCVWPHQLGVGEGVKGVGEGVVMVAAFRAYLQAPCYNEGQHEK